MPYKSTFNAKHSYADGVTVYIPTNNRLHLLKRAVESVLSQDFSDLFLLVVDDGSTDGTADFLKKLSSRDHRVIVLSNPVPRGACYSRNLAIMSTETELVTGLDDDDYLLPFHISSLVQEYLRRIAASDEAVVFPGMLIKRSENKISRNRHQRMVVSFRDLLSSNRAGNQALTSTYLLQSIGGFDESLTAWQDFELWIRLAKRVGTLYCTGVYSYVQDVSHDMNRISGKPPEVLHSAYDIVARKHLYGSSNRELLKLKLNYHCYTQVPLSVNELWLYLKSGIIVKPMYYFARKTFRSALWRL